MTNIKNDSRGEKIREIYADDESLETSIEEDINSMSQPMPVKKSRAGKVILTIILIIVIVFLALLIISKTTNWNILGLSKAPVGGLLGGEQLKASDWQAVFLSNGQVYFGKLKNENSAYPTLEDIYYLQVQDVPIQPALPATDEEGVQAAEQTQQQVVLIKFGTEIHRPVDKMYINRDHILMYEDLSEASTVVEAINNYKNKSIEPVE